MVHKSIKTALALASVTALIACQPAQQSTTADDVVS